MEAFMKWDPSMLVGNHKVDKEHMILVELINNVHSLITKNHPKKAKEEFMCLFPRLVMHMRDEELMMRTTDLISYFDEHKEDHDKIIVRFDEH